VEYRIRNAFFALLFIFITGGAFSQTNELVQRGSIPEELLRPRREESPRYPIDTVIGPIGQGQASAEAYGLARRIAGALLQGNTSASVLSSVNKAFITDCMTALNVVNPRYFRLGSGREEPDGSVSFLIRFAGREQGITGELFIRFEERITNPPPPPKPPASAPVTETEDETEGEENPIATEASANAAANAAADTAANAVADTAANAAAEATEEAATEAEEPKEAPPVYVPIIERRFFFEDLILEAPRTREEEILENRQRYDFSPYERFF